MEYANKVEIATISLWNYFAIVIHVIAFVILFMKAQKNASLKAFFIVQFSMFIWLIGKVLKTVSPTEGIRWFFIVFYYFGIILLGVSFLDFAYIYNKGKPLKTFVRIFIYGLGVVQFITVLTNPCHYLFYSRYNFFGDDFGKLFYLHIVINYIMILIGMVLCTQKFKKQIKEKNKIKSNIISFAIVFPLILNFVYITRLLETLFDMLKIQVFDITPIVYTWSLLIFVYTTFKYEFFDLAPVIKYEITERLNTPILLTDSDYNILYANNKLKTVFNVPQAVLKNILNTKSEVLKQDDRYYKYEFYEVNKMGHLKYIITFDDITSYLLARNALDTENVCIEEANEKLEEQIQLLKQTSRISARNYVARELHDVMGHSLVVTMKLLEVSKISYSKDKKRVVDSLEKARESVRLGFKEMLKVKENDVDAVYNVATLEREIRTMLKTVNFSGIRTNVYFRGSSQNIEEKAYDIIKKVSIELVTNTLKHSGATMLYLSIVFEKNSAFISLMDNGRGADDLTKGNGLNGIDSRLSLVGGKARYNTGEGEGFCANIVIPMQLLDKGA